MLKIYNVKFWVASSDTVLPPALHQWYEYIYEAKFKDRIRLLVCLLMSNFFRFLNKFFVESVKAYLFGNIIFSLKHRIIATQTHFRFISFLSPVCAVVKQTLVLVVQTIDGVWLGNLG